MILTCPACATRYFVETDRLGPEGRKVRCSNCAHEWTAEAPLMLTPAPKPDPAPEVVAPKPVHRSFRARVEARRKTRKAVAAGVVWGGMAAAVAVLMLGLVLFRSAVVGVWPATAGAYAFLKLPVNPTGFAIEDVKGAPALDSGRLILVASGALRNERDDARSAPPLRVSLIDSAGKRVASQVVAAPAERRVAPGEARGFKVGFVDPPGASHVQVEFAFDAPQPHKDPVRVADVRPAPTPSASVAPAPQPVAVAAKPLPASSPYALKPPPHG